MAGVNVDNSGLTYLHILDGVTETLNQSSKARNKVNQNYEWRGSHLEHKLHTARNHAVKFMSDGSAFPVADKEDYVSMKVGRKIIGGSIQLTDAVMATASKSPEVALDVVSAHTQGLMKNILKFENFFFSRDGTGAVATVKAAISGTTLKVDDARALWRGASYQVYNGASLVGTVVISNVARAPDASGFAVVTLESTLAGVTTGYKLYWDGAFGIAYTGLEALIDDSTPVGGGSTFQGVTMANEPQWTSAVVDNSGTLRALDPSLFRLLQASIYHNVGDEPGELDCMGTGWQLSNLDELYESALRLSPDSKVGGLSTPAFQSSLGKINMSPDSDAPYNRLFLVDYSQIYRGVQKKLGWRNQSGQIFMRSDSSGVWTATAIEIAEMYIKGRNSSGKILDLEENKISMI